MQVFFTGRYRSDGRVIGVAGMLGLVFLMLFMVLRGVEARFVSRDSVVAHAGSVTDAHDSVENEGVQRGLKDSQVEFDIRNKKLILYSSPVDLRSGDDLSLQSSLFIPDLEVSMNGTYIYYIQSNRTRIGDNITVEESIVKRVAFTTTTASMAYTVSVVAGPWSQGQNSSRLSALLLLDEDNLIVSDTKNSSLRRVHIPTRRVKVLTAVSSPAGLTRHPKLPNIFIALQDRIGIFSLDSESVPYSIQVLAGNSSEMMSDDISNSLTAKNVYNDSDIGTEVRFNKPRIGSQSISQNGLWLYVADTDNNVIRRVDTETGATTTVVGTKEEIPLKDRDGDRVYARFNKPTSLAFTSDGCNLFIAEWQCGAIRWVTFEHPDGRVLEVKTVVKAMFDENDEAARQQKSISSIMLTRDDKYLIVASGGNIFRLRVNSSALHRCTGTNGDISEPTQDPSSPRQPPTASSPHQTRLTVGLTVGAIVFIISIVGCVVLWVVLRGPKKGGKGQTDRKLGVECGMSVYYDSESISILQGEPQDGQATSGGSLTTGTNDAGGQRLYSPLVMSPYRGNVLEEHYSCDIKRISLAEVREATDNFSLTYLLAGKSGGYGDVYRATMNMAHKTLDVAIKVMKGGLDEVKYKQFKAEVMTLSQVRHRNLCKLLFYCMEDNMCILIYPFIKGGSLHDRLHELKTPSTKPVNQHAQLRSWSPVRSSSSSHYRSGESTSMTLKPLTWQDRTSVARQVATGLHYLHEGVYPPFLHRDVKSRNVLIEGEGDRLRALLIDFGLAKPGRYNPEAHRGSPAVAAAFESGDSMAESTITRSGTPGYMAPEYQMHLTLTTSNDVYAFGVVLLELVTGRRAVIKSEKGLPVFLVAWLRQCLSESGLTYDKLESIVDPRLKSALTPHERQMVCRLAVLGHSCTDDLPEKRPSMKRVLKEIEDVMEGEPVEGT